MTSTIAIAAARYRALWDEVQAGPQIEGISAEEAETSLIDPQTVTTSDYLPGLVPMAYAGWYNPAFCDAIAADDRLYYAALPGSLDPTTLRTQLIQQFPGQTIVVFYDQLANGTRRDELAELLDQAGLDALETVETGSGPDGVATLTQFAGPVRIKHRAGVPDTENQSFALAVAMSQTDKYLNHDRAARTLSKPVTNEDFDQIWEFYPESFRQASEKHPLVQSFDRDELRALLDAPDSIAAVSVADDRIVSLAFLSPLQSCPWLNVKDYEANYPVETKTGNVIHMPTVVTDQAYRGQDMTTLVFRQLVGCVSDSGNDLIFLGECNDFTVGIIPVLADAFFAGKESRMTLDWQQIAVYHYGAFRCTVPA